jgi:hypothetical protein
MIVCIEDPLLFNNNESKWAKYRRLLQGHNGSPT